MLAPSLVLHDVHFYLISIGISLKQRITAWKWEGIVLLVFFFFFLEEIKREIAVLVPSI
jgi:hypothetical protein